MLTLEKSVFLRMQNDTAEYSLRPGKIVAKAEGIYSAEMEEDFMAEGGQEIFLYYEKDRVFVKQAVLIEAVAREETTVVDFKLHGAPESAENRQCYRVSTLISDLSAKLGKEEDCKLLDVSVEGFSVAARTEYKPEDIVEATLVHEGNEFWGKARIQSIRPWHKGLVRYGLSHLSQREGGGQLRQGMQKIASEVQRQQLVRMSAGAL